MVQKVLSWLVTAVVIFGLASWLAKPGNGARAGDTAGQLGSTGKHAVGGAIDVGVGFAHGISGK